MTALKVFVLVGIIDSFDNDFATVELNTSPALNGGPALAVMPVSAFPCEIKEGTRFYVVQLRKEYADPVIVCQKEYNETR
jgi:hypothetical protein